MEDRSRERHTGIKGGGAEAGGDEEAEEGKLETKVVHGLELAVSEQDQ